MKDQITFPGGKLAIHRTESMVKRRMAYLDCSTTFGLLAPWSLSRHADCLERVVKTFNQDWHADLWFTVYSAEDETIVS